jgi:ribosomal protein S18 acetylase RimI-like enzyme
MFSLVIRPASIKDVPSIVKIRSEAFSDEELFGYIVPDNNIYTSEEKLRKTWNKSNRLKDDSEVFVAASKEKIVGFIVFNMKNIEDNIDNIIVAKKEQGKGIGKALVEYIEQLGKSRGLEVITTDTTENSHGFPWKAFGFWKKMGYKDTGKRINTRYDFKIISLIKKLKKS